MFCRVIGYLIIILITFQTNGFAQNEYEYVKEKKENIRLEPKGVKIAEALAGTKVKVLERKENWTKVEFTGWIWEQSLTKDPTKVQGFTVRASHILFKTPDQANSILKQIKQGASFEELAKEHSLDKSSGARAGDIGKFSPGDFGLPKFESAVLKLKVGEISEVIQTSLGFHIIKRTQ